MASPSDTDIIKGFPRANKIYRKFVQGYGQVVGPLTKQLKKDCYRWNEEAE